MEQQSPQSQILLQCRPTGVTTPALHPTKLLPQPTTSNVEKEEIFAVPKVSILNTRNLLLTTSKKLYKID